MPFMPSASLGFVHLYDLSRFFGFKPHSNLSPLATYLAIYIPSSSAQRIGQPHCLGLELNPS